MYVIETYYKIICIENEAYIIYSLNTATFKPIFFSLWFKSNNRFQCILMNCAISNIVKLILINEVHCKMLTLECDLVAFVVHLQGHVKIFDNNSSF